LVEETVKRASENAAKEAERSGGDAAVARKKAVLPFIAEGGTRLRFHDVRHQAITELGEGGPSDAAMMALAGHMSREMLEHYSHVRMAAKREALDKLAGGQQKATEDRSKDAKADASTAVASHATSQKLPK
jgi:integrase